MNLRSLKISKVRDDYEFRFKEKYKGLGELKWPKY
jgi:hypothetical protein